jgi:hypothetical protein
VVGKEGLVTHARTTLFPSVHAFAPATAAVDATHVGVLGLVVVQALGPVLPAPGATHGRGRGGEGRGSGPGRRKGERDGGRKHRRGLSKDTQVFKLQEVAGEGGREGGAGGGGMERWFGRI